MDWETIPLLRIAASCIRDACLILAWKDAREPTKASYLINLASSFVDEQLAYEDDPGGAEEHRIKVKEMIRKIVEAIE